MEVAYRRTSVLAGKNRSSGQGQKSTSYSKCALTFSQWRGLSVSSWTTPRMCAGNSTTTCACVVLTIPRSSGPDRRSAPLVPAEHGLGLVTAKVVMVAVAAQSALSGSGKLLLVTAPTVVLSFALTI